MRRTLPAVLAIFFLLTGCWDYKDLNKLCIVTGMGFDPSDAGVKVTLEIVDRSSPVKKEGLQTQMVQTEGESIGEALQKAEKQLDYELYFGNMAVVVFNEKLLDDPSIYLAWLKNHKEVRETVYPAAAMEAGELLQTPDGGVSAFALRDILDAQKDRKPVELYCIKDNIPMFSLKEEENGSDARDSEDQKPRRRPVLSGMAAVGGGG